MAATYNVSNGRKFTDEPSLDALTDGSEILLVHTAKGVKALKASALSKYIAGDASIAGIGDGTVTGAIANLAGRMKDDLHNSMMDYRVIGAAADHASLLPADKIADGSFEGIYPGQMLTSDLGNLIVAGCDLFTSFGDNISFGHHLVMTFDGVSGTGKMNTTNSIGDKGYATCRALTDDGTVGARLAAIKKRLQEIFGDRLQTFRADYPNAYANGVATGWEWVDACVELMSEAEVYGTNVWASSGYETGIDKTQFPIFRLKPELTTAHRNWYWLRTVQSASSFCCADDSGAADRDGASYVGGVRPFFLIA